MSKLTSNELKALTAIVKSEYNDSGSLTATVWSFTIGDNSDLKLRSIPGVVSSLVKKGFVVCGGAGNEATVQMTAEGVKAYTEATTPAPTVMNILGISSETQKAIRDSVPESKSRKPSRDYVGAAAKRRATIRARRTPVEYCALQTKSRANNEKRDCAVIALSAVTGIDYARCLAALAAAGRKPGKGTYFHLTAQAAKALGFRVTNIAPKSFIRRYPGVHAGLKNVTTHHPTRFNKVWADGANYLMRTNRHLAGVVNGVTVDWSARNSLRAHEVYRVEKI
jgi:hypothetical protein